ncbi:hypothetical protein NL676_013124 [Syzygium grande]|nr:hypothetical protein NL676_013124 [Syzygium grande]
MRETSRQLGGAPAKGRSRWRWFTTGGGAPGRQGAFQDLLKMANGKWPMSEAARLGPTVESARLGVEPRRWRREGDAR